LAGFAGKKEGKKVGVERGKRPSGRLPVLAGGAGRGKKRKRLYKTAGGRLAPSCTRVHPTSWRRSTERAIVLLDIPTAGRGGQEERAGRSSFVQKGETVPGNFRLRKIRVLRRLNKRKIRGWWWKSLVRPNILKRKSKKKRNSVGFISK